MLKGYVHVLIFYRLQCFRCSGNHVQCIGGKVAHPTRSSE